MTVAYTIVLTFIAIVISYYKGLILKNLYLILNIFIFITPIIIVVNLYISFNHTIDHTALQIKDLFFNCDRSALSFGKFIFKENSHFSMVAVPVILSLFFLKKKLLTNLNKTFFIIFVIVNFIFFSTTLLVSLIVCSLYFIFYLLIDNSLGFNLTKYDRSDNNLLSYTIHLRSLKKIIILLIVIVASYSMSVLPSCKKKIYETVYLITKVENEITKANSPQVDLNSSSSTFYDKLDNFEDKGSNDKVTLSQLIIGSDGAVGACA